MVFYDQDHTCLTEADIKLQTKFANVFANPYLRITRWTADASQEQTIET